MGSPAESRVSSNTTRVRMFGKEKLNKDVASEKWDQVKIVCTQPFNKHVRYGLSFVTITGPTTSVTTTTTSSSSGEKKGVKLGAFRLKEEEGQSSLSVGSFFAKRKEALSPAAALRSETTLASFTLKKEESGEKRKRSDDGAEEDGRRPFYQLKEASNKKVRIEGQLPKRDSLPGESPVKKEKYFKNDDERKEDRHNIKKEKHESDKKKDRHESDKRKDR